MSSCRRRSARRLLLSTRHAAALTVGGAEPRTDEVASQGYSIQRIRQFYMRKVKFTQASYAEKLQRIVTGNVLRHAAQGSDRCERCCTADFPRLDDIHPFYADMCNVLYDRDHYKLALAQVDPALHSALFFSRHARTRTHKPRALSG